MKLTKDRLKQIIKEELEEMMVDEATPPPPPPAAMPEKLTFAQYILFIENLQKQVELLVKTKAGPAVTFKQQMQKYFDFIPRYKQRQKEFESKIWIIRTEGNLFQIGWIENDGKQPPKPSYENPIHVFFQVRTDDQFLPTVKSLLARAIAQTPKPTTPPPPPPPKPGQAPTSTPTPTPGNPFGYSKNIPPPPPPKPRT